VGKANNMTEREFALHVVQRLQEAGFQALWAGGCVRDELLGRVPKDYDVATNALPERVRQLFRKTVAVGMSFGVVEVLGPRQSGQVLKAQVATFRSDGQYSDGRHPDAVVFSSAEEDAHRRDFTINGMFFDPVKGELLDFVGGQEDLQRQVLRAIGNPWERFAEDKLRLLRAVRMATRFALEIEPTTTDAIRAMASQVTVVSAERIAEELRQLLVHPQRVRALSLMDELGLLPPILPELQSFKEGGAATAGAEREDLWQHTLQVMALLGPEPSLPLAFAGLLHESDAAGPHGAARAAELVAERLRLSNAEKDRIVWLIAHQRSLCHAQTLRLSLLKPLLAHESIRDLLVLHRADALSRGESDEQVIFCEEKLIQWAQDLNPRPLLTGEDLIGVGLKPGPRFKSLLEAVREAQLEEQISTREEAEELVRRLLEEC
jgi:poly(A) polymerase